MIKAGQETVRFFCLHIQFGGISNIELTQATVGIH